jgi:hypothetical protein
MIWTRQKLEKFLQQNNVDTSSWGKGMAKTLQHLFYELVKGECELKVEKNRVVRDVKSLSITVYYKDERLEEEYQKMKDGRFRRRVLDASVAEKLTKDDGDLNEAVKRALEEELSITKITDDQMKYNGEADRTVENSQDFPGIAMNLKLYKFDVTLKYEQYHPYGYIEHQDDKDIYFVWVKRNIPLAPENVL